VIIVLYMVYEKRFHHNRVFAICKRGTGKLNVETIEIQV